MAAPPSEVPTEGYSARAFSGSDGSASGVTQGTIAASELEKERVKSFAAAVSRKALRARAAASSRVEGVAIGDGLQQGSVRHASIEAHGAAARAAALDPHVQSTGRPADAATSRGAAVDQLPVHPLRARTSVLDLLAGRIPADLPLRGVSAFLASNEPSVF